MKQHYLHFREVASDSDGDIGVLRYTMQDKLAVIVQHEDAEERMKQMLQEHFDAEVKHLPRLQVIVMDVYSTHRLCKYTIEVDSTEPYWADIEVRITNIY